ncbi:hypothetical protein N7495_009460 [Penicillium taxi]|uniref:uncharacterized protein n=1 Tax=Penicillium taxi TaxID=168475 RepID=UPI002544E0DC|nr:uncharacterized protein N7495_009460 [Penicillium taxi]KAJ5884950.1 hypothetical protein N7495_009460 [Penicillium taxi]
MAVDAVRGVISRTRQQRPLKKFNCFRGTDKKDQIGYARDCEGFEVLFVWEELRAKENMRWESWRKKVRKRRTKMVFPGPRHDH